jgi:hypothetical protein
LNYCSSCGTRVEAEKPVTIRTGTPILAVGAIFIALVGLIGFYPIMTELLHSPMQPPAVFLILLAYLLGVITMFSVLIWQSRKGTTEIKQKGNRSSDGFGGHQAFRGINTAQLPEPTQQPASVTEHTTRTLDQVPLRER